MNFLSRVFQKAVIKDADLRAEKNQSQAEIILDFFKQNRHQSFTAWQVHESVNFKLITSTRRAMTQLTKAGHLVKTSERALGNAGDLNYKYKLS